MLYDDLIALTAYCVFFQRDPVAAAPHLVAAETAVCSLTSWTRVACLEKTICHQGGCGLKNMEQLMSNYDCDWD